MGKWKMVRLGDVCTIKSGNSVKKHLEQSSGDIPYVKVADMNLPTNLKSITGSSRFLNKALVRKKNVFPVGTTIFPKRGGAILTNKKRILSVPICADLNIMGLVPIAGLLPKFLYYYALNLDLRNLGSGSSIPQINNYDIAPLKVPLPPLDEQERIVAILDEAFAAIDTAVANTQKNLENAKELFEGYLEKIFKGPENGWIETAFKYVCTLQRGFDLPKRLRKQGTFPLLSSSGRIDSHNQSKVSGPGVVVGRSGSVGNVFMVDTDFWPLNTTLYVKNFHGNNPVFIYWLLRYLKLYNYASGTGVPTLNRNHLHEIKTFLPASILEQIAAIDDVHAMQEKTTILFEAFQEQLALFMELKQSMLEQAFTGNLGAPNLDPLTKIVGISSTDLHAGILAIAYQAHEKAGARENLGRTKCEKIIHMVESYCGIDLERTPVKDAAGPNDFMRMKKKVEPRAKKAGYFTFRKKGEIELLEISNKELFDGLVVKTRSKLGKACEAIDDLLDIMVKMNTRQAEIVATVYAGWNNLIIDKAEITDEAIVYESRENWHEKKLEIDRVKFFRAIEWMRGNGIVPTGIGKKVLRKSEL